jgi:sugar phosphate isomerase/epimerase
MKKIPMNRNVELLASYWTISGGALPHTDKEYSPFDFEDRVEAAAQAGFKGIGIWHADLDHILEKRTLKEMKRILDDNGIKYLELEFLTDWFLEGERKRKSDLQKAKLLIAAEVLGPNHVKVGDFFQEQTSMPRLIEAFAALCAEAEDRGTRIGFELMPFAMIRTLEESLKLVQGTNAKNGGICFDLWHLVKLGIPYEHVGRVPLQYITSIELNDGTFKAPWSLHEDTINHRRLCGEGEFDIKSFIDVMQKAGYTGPWGIEVLSQELRKRPLEELVSRAFHTTMAQFQGAKPQSVPYGTLQKAENREG